MQVNRERPEKIARQRLFAFLNRMLDIIHWWEEFMGQTFLANRIHLAP